MMKYMESKNEDHLWIKTSSNKAAFSLLISLSEMRPPSVKKDHQLYQSCGLSWVWGYAVSEL